MNATITSIGHIETPYTHIDQCPSNIEAEGPKCRLVVKPELTDALLGLTVGRRILILYWFENVDRVRLQRPARRTGEWSGIFALRTPHRPNPIGAAIVTILGIKENVIEVQGLDCLSGTPLIDIKPAKEDEHQ